MFWVVGITVLATSLVLIVLQNFKTPEKVLERKVEHRHKVSDPQFRREMSVLLGPAIVPGNEVTALQNGDEIFPAMLQAIRSAQTSIIFETFIYWSGEIGEEFSHALSERARAGVPVSVIIDWVGSTKMEQSLLDSMQVAGVRIHRYRPLHWYNIGRMNNRTHRKLLVVDGRIGFTDIRSIRLNDEASLNIYSSDFATQMTAVFEDDLLAAERYSFASWKSRPLREKFSEKVLLPIKSQL
jgi:cardiolipin synthase